MADPGAMPVLIKGLGDPSKMVQTSAAYALRMVLSRRQDAAPAGRKLLAAALASPDARTRWGATRVFNQHFKELTGDPDLLAALERDLNDPVPFVRFEAAWRIVALVLLAGGQAGGAPEHAGSAGHAAQHRDRSDGAARLAGEHLRSAG